MVEHLKNNLDIDISVSIVRNFIRSQGYHGRAVRKQYFVSEANRKKDCISQIIILTHQCTTGIG